MHVCVNPHKTPLNVCFQSLNKEPREFMSEGGKSACVHVSNIFAGKRNKTLTETCQH